MKTNLKHVD